MSEDAMGNKELFFENFDRIRIKLEHTFELFGEGAALEKKISRAEAMRKLSDAFKQAVEDYLGREV